MLVVVGVKLKILIGKPSKENSLKGPLRWSG
jgi:hypothetical protein